MHFLAVTVSNRHKALDYDEMPYYCHVHEPVYFPRVVDRERFDRIAGWWNEAHKLALEYYPEATHFLDLSTYFLPQTLSLRKLVRTYETIDDPNIIFSGNVWAKRQWIVPFMKEYKTYDSWAMPDLENFATWHLIPPRRGLVQISSVGNPMIYPVYAWREHAFHNRSDIWTSFFYNNFCADSGLPCFADLRIRFYRDSADSDIPKKLWFRVAGFRAARQVRKLWRKPQRNNP